jgi:hypothetical protein
MKRLLAIMLGLSLCTAASADFNTGFEAPDYSASAAGVLLTGQQGWYLPSGSSDFKTYTYAGNLPGFAANPEGSDQFVAGRSDGTNFGRAQHDHDFSTSNQWVLSFDFAAVWDGTAPSAANLGSFSLQPSTTTRSFIALNNWTDLANPAGGWKAEFNVFDSANVALNNQSPGAAWTNLIYNHWYRETVAVDFTTNRLTAITIRDLSTSVTDTYNPTGWYLQGGASPTMPLATAIRMFAGGAAGNNTAWDNVSALVPEPGSLALLGLGALALVRRR